MARKLKADPHLQLTPEQQDEAKRIFEILKKTVASDLQAISDQLATTTDKTIFGANEFVLRDLVHKIGAKALETALEERKKGGYRGSSIVCSGCQNDAKCHRANSSRDIVTLVGAVTINRHYYYCEACQSGVHPRDADLHIQGSRYSLAAQEVITLAGVLASFEEGATKTLTTMSGISASASTVQRITERVGGDVGERLDEGETFGPPADWKWTTDASGKTVAYVGVDHTGVPMQAPDGSKAEGRMAAVGMIWNAKDEQQGGEARYLSVLTDGLKKMGDALRNQGAQVGMDRADRWVAISDGGAGLEDWLNVNFPRVDAIILDFYHAATHLNDWAKAWHPHDATAAQKLATSWCHWLKHDGGDAVLAMLRACDVSEESQAMQEEHRKLLVYFGNQSHRMDYPTYRANGWQIGSGPVEAACKQVVNQRLKGTGMRWRESGADAVCRLRGLFRSEASQWDNYWATVAA